MSRRLDEIFYFVSVEDTREQLETAKEVVDMVEKYLESER